MDFKGFLYGMAGLIALCVGVYLLLFVIPAVIKSVSEYIGDFLFNIRKKVFEAANPKYEYGRLPLFGSWTDFATKRKSYEAYSIDSEDKYVIVYKNKLEFEDGKKVGLNTTLVVNAEQLCKSLKAWKCWNPEKNGLKVEYVNSQIPTFRLRCEYKNYQELNKFLIEVPEKEFIETLEKVIDL